MRRLQILPRIVSSFLIGGIGLAAGLGCSRDSGSGEAPPPPTVTVATPLLRSIVEWDEYTGRLEPVESVSIRARVSGYLYSIHFDEGSVVEKDDLLFVIDPRPFEAALAAAQASQAEADALMASARAIVSMAEATLGDARSAVDLAESRLARARQALETNAISREQVDIRENELDQAKAAVASADADIASAQAQVANADAARALADARLTTAQLDLEYTNVRAPISGRIGEHLVTKGNLVSGGSALSTLLTTIVSLDPIHVTFDANEQAFLKYFRLADSGGRKSSRDFRNPVYMALADETGYPHLGHMDFVDNRIDPNTGTIRGRAIFRNADPQLTAGLFAKVRIPGSAPYEAVMIPDSAITSSQSSRMVMLVSAEGIAEPRTVTLGPLKDGLRIIRSGLDGTERIIIAGLQRVRPGSPVTAEEGIIEASPIQDGLPNEYVPVPQEHWIRRTSVGSVDASSGATP